MGLWFKDRTYDDELTFPSPENAPPAVMGDTVQFTGEFWVITGWDEPAQEVYIARDKELLTKSVEDIGLTWEKPSPVGAS